MIMHIDVIVSFVWFIHLDIHSLIGERCKKLLNIKT